MACSYIAAPATDKINILLKYAKTGELQSVGFAVQHVQVRNAGSLLKISDSQNEDKFWLLLFKPLSFFDINHLLFSSEELKD